uniref:Signal peptide peptidase n=1 Tax=Mesocestoides corti TaxID=53468 RepID=A0A5K3FPL4_MESCO
MDQNITLLNVAASNNATRYFTTESGIASAALFFMAILPIYVGAHRSVDALQKSLKDKDLSIISSHEAAMFPVYASGALFGIFILFKLFAAEYVNIVISCYFFGIGTSTVFFLIRPYVVNLVPSIFPNTHFKLTLTESKDDAPQPQQECVSVDFERKDIFPLIIALIIGCAYIFTKHWVANNLIGLAIAVVAVEYLHLDKVSNGCILLGGLFIYDIFWVFGTGVMVFVATNFDGPIKVVFPRDLLTNGFFSKDVAMLGLGDIVVPGIFLALLLRFDDRLNRQGSRTYFWTGFIAYIIGLLTTFVVMYSFHHAQPALLYLVPLCLGLPLTVALIKGDFKELMAYKDIPQEVENRLKAEREARESSEAEKKAN